MSLPQPTRAATIAVVAALAVAMVPQLSGTDAPVTPGASPALVTPEPTRSAPSDASAGQHPARAEASDAGRETARATGRATGRATEPPSTPVATDEILPDHLSGRELLAADPARLPQVARRSGLSTAGLTSLLREDETSWVSPQGRVYFREPAAGTPHDHSTGAAADHEEAGHEESGATEQASAEPAALGSSPALARRYPDIQTFSLESKPGASRTILIDADGADVRGTAWNSGTRSMSGGSWPGFDSDGAPGGFTSSEHAWVQEVWRQVAETYAPFDVNVTTRDTGAGAWDRTSDADTRYGARVVVTTSAKAQQEACGGCLGIAWLNTFGSVDRTSAYQPAWVFITGSTSPTIAAQAVSHEVGHNLGLSHDSRTDSSSGYYPGTGRWGPIMGSAMDRAVSHWSKGEYAGATQTQDDLAVIQQHRLPLRADDHGDALASARVLGSATAYDVEGIIGTRSDRDVFRVDLACATTLTAKVVGIGQQATLDLRLDLLDGSGETLTSDSPTNVLGSRRSPSQARTMTGMDAAVSRVVPAGSYYLRVDGVGSGDQAAIASANGWSDYASLGQYRLTATGCATAPSSTPSSDPSGVASPAPTGTPGTPSVSPTPTVRPAPKLRRPQPPRVAGVSPGRRGGRVSAVVRWRAAADATSNKVRGYRLSAELLGSRNKVRRTYRTALVRPGARSVEVVLPRGRYRFAVQAVNPVGYSSLSARSKPVQAR